MNSTRSAILLTIELELVLEDEDDCNTVLGPYAVVSAHPFFIVLFWVRIRN